MQIGWAMHGSLFIYIYIYIYYLRLQTTWAKITTAVISTCTWCAVCQWYVPISPVYTVLMWNRCILPSTLAWASWKYTWCQNLIPSTARWYHILAGLWEVCKLCKATQTTLAATTIAEITYTKLQCAWSVLTCGLLFDIVSLIFVLVCFIAFIHFCIAEARLQVFANPEQIGDIVECMLTLFRPSRHMDAKLALLGSTPTLWRLAGAFSAGSGAVQNLHPIGLFWQRFLEWDIVFFLHDWIQQGDFVGADSHWLALVSL